MAALEPSLRVIAPMRELSCTTLEDKLAILERNDITDRPEFHADISRDRNLWGCGQVHGGLSDPWKAPREDLYQMTRRATDAPEEPLEITIGFHRGIPQTLDGEDLDPIALIETLNLGPGTLGVLAFIGMALRNRRTTTTEK